MDASSCDEPGVRHAGITSVIGFKSLWHYILIRFRNNATFSYLVHDDGEEVLVIIPT